MEPKLNVALVGIGGYGKYYVSALLDAAAEQRVRLVGTVDPQPEACLRWSELRQRGVPHFNSLAEFYAHHQADLVTIASPIQFHADQVCTALAHGSHVLCEKPLSATIEEAHRMLAAQQAADRHVAIGYQWSFSGAIQELKADILAGRFGKPRRFRCLSLWPRDEKYYTRNKWAGAINDAAGRRVFDSPVNNACAHQLHNMLYVLGDTIGTSATPATVDAGLFRAHPITNYDTAALRCRTTSGVDVLFIVSHVGRTTFGPVFTYEFDDAVVEYADAPHAIIKATFKSGSTICYGSPDEPRDRKIWMTIDAIRRGKPSLCPIEAATPHAQVVDMAQQTPRGIIDFPRRLVRRSGAAGERVTQVQGLDAALRNCYDQWALPSELGLAWAAREKQIARDEVAA